MVGTLGAVGAVGAGGIAVTAVEASLVPMSLVAVAVQAYVVPLVSPLIVTGESALVPVKVLVPSVQEAA